MKDLVSIIIPAYNVEKYISKCIQSVVNQTYKNIEIILVDDGSPDNSPVICDEWKEKDQRIRVIHKENGGLSDARNFGIDIAKGKYLIFIDSDDYVEDNMVDVMLKNIKQNNADISICNRYYLYEKSNKLKLRFKKQTELKIMDTDEALIELMCMNNFDMSAWCKMYKSELFKNIRFPVEKISEDYYIMYKLFSMSKTIVYDSTPLLYYLQREGSISKKKKMMFDYNYAAHEQMEYIIKNHKSLTLYAQSAYVLSFLTIYNQCVASRTSVDKETVRKFKAAINKYKSSVYKNKKIGFERKIEVFMFLHMRYLYNFLIRIYKRV